MFDPQRHIARWHHEQTGQAETVETLIRHAHIALESAGVSVSPSKVSRRVRAQVAQRGIESAERMIASYAATTASHGNFDAYCLTYRDPVGEQVAHDLDAGNWTERSVASR